MARRGGFAELAICGITSKLVGVANGGREHRQARAPSATPRQARIRGALYLSVPTQAHEGVAQIEDALTAA